MSLGFECGDLIGVNREIHSLSRLVVKIERRVIRAGVPEPTERIDKPLTEPILLDHPLQTPGSHRP